MKKSCTVLFACAGLLWLGAAQAAVDWNARLHTAFIQMQAAPPLAALRAGAEEKTRRELTMLLMSARLHWGELAPDTQQLIQPWLARPTDSGNLGEVDWRYGATPEATPITTTYFKIHYIDQSVFPGNTNAATTTFANQVATELEYLYSIEHATLGYAAVPSDSTSTTNGGDALFDVYLANTGAYGIYGYVQAEGDSTETTRPLGAWSYMVLDNNFTEFVGDPLDSLKVTVAHEYFHAIQFGYSIYSDGAFMEHTSTWIEDIVYPGIHDNYQYLGEPYVDANGNGQYDAGESFTDRRLMNGVRDEGMPEYPDYPLDVTTDSASATIVYGHFLWARYLYEKFDGGTPGSNGVIKRIFVKSGQAGNSGTYSSIDTVLSTDYGSSLAAAYQEYATWLYDKDNFSDGTNYPLVWVDRVVSGTDTIFGAADSPSLLSLSSGSAGTQYHLSSVLTMISSPSGSYNFISSGGTAALTLLVDTGTGTLTHQVVSLSGGAGTWTAPSGTTRAIAVISNTSSSTDGMDWTFGVSDAVALPRSGGSGGGGGGVFPGAYELLAGILFLLIRFYSTRDTNPRNARCRIQSASPVCTRRR